MIRSTSDSSTSLCSGDLICLGRLPLLLEWPEQGVPHALKALSKYLLNK